MHKEKTKSMNFISLDVNFCPDFWKLVNRYELSERTRGYLITKGLEDLEPIS
jgi:hypothetical protein